MDKTRSRAEQRRQEKLDDIERQILDGSIVVRQMTAAERERDAPRAQAARRTFQARRDQRGAGTPRR